jgi:ankyrin repeat protein
MRAVWNNNIKEARTLLLLGTNVETINDKVDRGDKELRLLCWHVYPNNALEIAVFNEHLEMVQLLLEHGAQVRLNFFSSKLKDMSKEIFKNKEPKLSTNSVLDFLPDKKVTGEKLRRRAKIIQCILAKGISLDPKHPLLKLMLEVGATSPVKKTLMLVQKDNSKKLFDPTLYDLGIYREYNTQMLTVQISYHTPISYALSFNQTEMVDFLLDFACKELPEKQYQKILEETFIAASYYNNAIILKSCFERSPSILKKIDTVVSNQSKLNALKTAASAGSMNAIKWLFERGADLNHQQFGLSIFGHERNTALFFALKLDPKKNQKEEIVLFLLNKGAKLESDALEAIKRSNFQLNLEKVYCPIEFLDDPKWGCKNLVETFKTHNKILREKTMKTLDEVLDRKMPPVLISEICDFYFPLAIEQQPPKAINKAPSQIQRTKGLT